jgi:hypothetical protein
VVRTVQQIDREESAAMIASAWERRNCPQVGLVRHAAPSIPALVRTVNSRIEDQDNGAPMPSISLAR